MRNGRPIPSSNALNQFSVNASGEMDVIYQPLYDYATYLAAGQTSLNFFQNPIGQLGKTREDTNMESAGQLPAPQKFVVEAISIDFFPGAVTSAGNTNWEDAYTVFQSGYLDFVVGSKSRLQQAPLGAFPPPYRLGGSSGSAAAVDYSSFAGQMFNIIPVTLPANQNFSVSLNWAVGLPISVDARIGVKLHGNLYRSVQ